MLKEVILFFVAAVSFGQTFSNEVPQNQRNVDFNEYYAYTPVYIDAPARLTNLNLEILSNRDTIVVVHGHGGSRRHLMNEDIANGILRISRNNSNVLIVDWSIQASLPYSTANAAVPFIGTNLGDYLSSLRTVGVPPERIHIVGFNLGAHIAGWAGRTLRIRGTPVARITALDPSKSNSRLARTDANYVEVIHTDSGLFGNGIGEQGMGHVDFFPNGGSSQPGCLLHSCCHNRAWQLFAASTGWKRFTARCCSSMTQVRLNTCRGSEFDMGNSDVNKQFNGCALYRVNTRSTFPF